MPDQVRQPKPSDLIHGKKDIISHSVKMFSNLTVEELEAVTEILVAIAEKAEEPDWECIAPALRPAFKEIWEDVKPDKSTAA